MVAQNILIEHQDGKIPAYLSDQPSGAMGGVIVISAIFGVDDDTQRICDRLADAGYPAMALNMFWQDDTDAGPLSGDEHEKAKARSLRAAPRTRDRLSPLRRRPPTRPTPMRHDCATRWTTTVV